MRNVVMVVWKLYDGFVVSLYFDALQDICGLNRKWHCLVETKIKGT